VNIMEKRNFYMVKRIFIAGILVMLIASACSGLSILGLGGNAASNQNAQNQFDPAKLPVQQKLGYGILKLEGTPLAVTADEAKSLLPLWKALTALSTNQNTTSEEIDALFQQMQDLLTTEQVSAIEKMTWTQNDLQALSQKYGVRIGQGGPGGGNASNLTAEQRATRQAQFQSQRQNGGGGGGGFAGPGGFPQDGGGPGGFGGGNNRNNSSTGQQRTPSAQGARIALGGMNRLFADAVIKMLQQRAGA
jgi:hypothetical protein